MNIYTQLLPTINQELGNLQQELVKFPIVLIAMCSNVFCETLFVNPEEIELQRKIEKKKFKQIQRRDEINRLPQDLQKIEIRYISREEKNRNLDEKNNIHPDEQILQMRRENFIKRHLTEYQQRYLYPLSSDPKIEKELRKIEKSKLNNANQDMEKWRMSTEKTNYKMLPLAIFVCLIAVIVEITDDIFKKIGLNLKKTVGISCMSLIGYAIYVVI